jgi:hypothetical protein
MYHANTLTALLFGVFALAAPTEPQQYHKCDNCTSPPTAGGLTLIQQLLLAPTAVERIALLSDADFKYDFNNPPSAAVTTGKGGRTVRADRDQFPALIGTGVSMTVGFIGPCGFNTPHTHPRSSQINIVVKGRLGTEFIAENGARSIVDTLEKFQMTVFPQGAVHTEFNPDCTDAVFVAGFADEDPGVQQSAQTFFGLGGEIVEAALDVDAINGESIETFRDRIPANVALGVDSCLKKCGIPKKI